MRIKHFNDQLLVLISVSLLISIMVPISRSNIDSKNELSKNLLSFNNFDLYFKQSNNEVFLYYDEYATLNVGYSVKQTNDEGYIVCGCSEKIFDNHFESFALLIKYDENGNEMWNKTYPGLNLAVGTSVDITDDNVYVITGYTASESSEYVKVLLIKTDQQGNIIWEKFYKIGDASVGYSICITNNSDYILSGLYIDNRYEYNVLLMKIDTQGNQLWNKSYLSGELISMNNVKETENKDYILTGSIGDFDFKYYSYLIKTDQNGNEKWNRTFSYNDYTILLSVIQTNDTGYLLSGSTISEDQSKTYVLLIKTNSDGFEEWNKTYSALYHASGAGAVQTSDNGYVITGSTYTDQLNNAEILLLKTDYYGVEEWNTSFQFKNFYGMGISIDICSDNGFITTGQLIDYEDLPMRQISSDCITIKTDDAGNMIWYSRFGEILSDQLTAIINGPYHGYIGKEIQFNGNSSGGTPPYNYSWDFGDGNISNLQNPVHNYSRSGNFTVSLIVTDNESNIAENSTYALIQNEEDITPPTIDLVKPGRFLYINNKKLFPLPSPAIIGGIDIIVNATDKESGVKEVRFYISGELKKIKNESPFEWSWNERCIFGRHITVEAYDYNNNMAQDSISVTVLNLFPELKYGVIKGKVIGGIFNLSIPGAEVTAKSLDFEKTTFTKRIPLINRGNFTLRLPLGTYMVSVEKDGFVSPLPKEIEVTLSENRFLKFYLERK